MGKQAKVPDHLKKYQKLFDKHMKFVDKVGQIVTSGHLIIESALDNVLDLIFFHAEHVREAPQLQSENATCSGAGSTKEQASALDSHIIRQRGA